MTDTAREAVARAICAADNHGWPDDTYDGRFSRRAFEKQADAAISAFTAWLEKEGWQIVPQEPTPDMCRAGAAAGDPFWSQGIVSDAHLAEAARVVGKAMLAAAPKPEIG